MVVNIIDADSIIFLVTHRKADQEELTLEQCKIRTDEFLRSVLELTESTHYVLYLTVGKNFRYNIYPQYKANRVGREKPPFFDEIKKYLEVKYCAQYYVGLEADDCCLITRKKYIQMYPEAKVFISCIDKDILNTEGSHYNYRKNEWVHTSEEDAEYRFWLDMITGQSGDGIQGIKGVGPKGAEKLFEEHLGLGLPMIVLGEYINTLGCNEGIQWFYSTYTALRILDTHAEFEKLIVEPIKIETNE